MNEIGATNSADEEKSARILRDARSIAGGTVPPSTRPPPHAPAPHRHPLERVEHEVLDRQPDQDHSRQSRKQVIGEQLVTALEDVPPPPCPEVLPDTGSAAMSVRQADAQPILRPDRMAGSAMRSSGPKSAMVLTAGLVLTR